MEDLVNVDPAIVRKLRESKAWSQDHLADAAGLSVRTIQRVESEGAASAETRMAVASALGVVPADLAPKSSAPRLGRMAKAGIACAIAGVFLGAVAASVGIFTGPDTWAERGRDFGLLGLFVGISCAALGILASRVVRPERGG